MELSLVICTRNRGHYLSNVLQKLKNLQSFTNWELVVVNNGSTDETGLILENFRHQFSHSFQIINEPRPGLGVARNAGWKKACGRLVIFTDDDCYPASDYLLKIIECFERKDIYFVGGRILLYDPTDYPITIQNSNNVIKLLPGDFAPAGLIQGANFAFRREVLEKVGGFDENMGAGTPYACEDVEILSRILGKGYQGIYSPEPVIYHHHRRKTEEEVSVLQKAYDFGRGAYYMKCLMNPSLRYICVKHWYWSIRNKKSLSRFLRELVGSIHFLSRQQFLKK